jgi:hypothetical protein
VIDKLGFGFAACQVTEIEQTLVKLMTTEVDCNEDISIFSRKNKTVQLAKIFDGLIGK